MSGSRVLSRREASKILGGLDSLEIRQRGSHEQYRHADDVKRPSLFMRAKNCHRL